MTILGKAIAGGMPLAAIAGRQDIFDQFRTNRVIAAGTFNACPVSMAAALITVRMLERDDGAIYEVRRNIQEKLEAALLLAATFIPAPPQQDAPPLAQIPQRNPARG